MARTVEFTPVPKALHDGPEAWAGETDGPVTVVAPRTVKDTRRQTMLQSGLLLRSRAGGRSTTRGCGWYRGTGNVWANPPHSVYVGRRVPAVSPLIPRIMAVWLSSVPYVSYW